MTDIPPFGHAPFLGAKVANLSNEVLAVAIAEALACEVAELHDWVIVAELRRPAGDGVSGKIITSGEGRERETLLMLRQASANLSRWLRNQ